MVDTAPPIHPIQKRVNYICQYCGKDGLASLDNWHDCTIDQSSRLGVVGRTHPRIL